MNLQNGGCTTFSGNIYVFGYTPHAFKVFKLTTKLQLLDSSTYNLDKQISSQYLEADCDTSHGSLNFFLQQKNKQTAQFLSFDKQFKSIASIENLDITKLKPISSSDHQTIINDSSFYVVKTAFDSTGKQFYLSKYNLTHAKNKAFDYKFDWQFNFEKTNIKNIHIFHIDSMQILGFVNINSGSRMGQWLLKINSKNGLLIKGKKINKDTTLTYRYCNYYIDKNTKETFLIGQITHQANLASPSPTLYLMRFDSLLSLLDEKTEVQKLTPANIKQKKLPNYLVQISDMNKSSLVDYNYNIDLYKEENSTFKYNGSANTTFSIEDDQLTWKTDPIREFPEIESFYFTQDKKDLNGKLFIDSTISNDRIFYNPPIVNVKEAFKLNTENMPVWILKKIVSKDETLVYASLKPGAKVYNTSILLSKLKNYKPKLLHITKNKYLIYFETDLNKVELELAEW